MPHEDPADNPYQQLMSLAMETEIALLGAALNNPSALDVCAPYVSEEDFSQPFLALCWTTMHEMHKGGVTPTPLLLSARISSPEVAAAILKDTGQRPIQLVAAMAANAATISGAPGYAKMVREYRHRRDLHTAGERLLTDAFDTLRPMRDVAAEASTVLESALNAGGQEQKRSMAEMIASSTAALAEDFQAPGVTTGLIAIDRMLGGFVPGDLIVTGARPSMGKSAFGLGTSLWSAMASYRRVLGEIDEEPWGVVIMTHEMTPEQVIQRCLTDLAFHLGNSADPVPYSRFRPSPGERPLPLSETQREGVRKASRLLPKLPLIIDGRPGMKVSEVTSAVRRHKKTFKAKGIRLALVTVDHIGLGKVLPDRERKSRVDEVGDITSSLKGLAVNEGTCVNALHQLSRANEGRENRRPALADFRDSGHIEQDADVMLGLYRDAYYLERNKESDPGKEQIRIDQLREMEHNLEAFCLKNRQGEVGMVQLWAEMKANAIRNFGYAKDR